MQDFEQSPTIYRVPLAYKDKVYAFYFPIKNELDDKSQQDLHIMTKEMDERAVNYDYMWHEGNYACDCNRSIFINRYCCEFTEMACGDEIKLLELTGYYL